MKTLFSKNRRIFALLLLGGQIVSGFFAATYAVEYNDFPNAACQSVDLVYLQPKPLKTTDPKKISTAQPMMVEVVKDKDDHWQLVPDQKTAAHVIPDGFSNSAVFKRFKFGTKYKKYCVGFQEALPVGPQGELSKSIGGDSGVDLIKNYVSMIYKFGSMFIPLVCVLIMVISGIQMSIGGIEASAFEDAKKRIIAAAISLVVLYSSAMILRTINPGFFT